MLGAFLCGYLLGSDSGVAVSGAQMMARVSADDVYVNVDALKRIKDPLEIVTSCTGPLGFFRREEAESSRYRRSPLLDCFKKIESSHPESFTILRITRQLGNDGVATFWFEFIETEKLSPETSS
jgi:hypothetical protein